MRLILIVGAGGFIGSVCRYLLSIFVQQKAASEFPFGTLSVNIIGCLLIGIMFGVAQRMQMSGEWRLLLITGVLGGFTTFSAFSIETINLFKGGNLSYVFIYILSSVIVGLAATLAGAWLSGFVAARL